MDWYNVAIEALNHYAVGGAVVVVLVILTLLGNMLARGITTIFVSVKVHGEWETTLDRAEGPSPHEEVTLHQFIHKVWGKTRKKDSGERYVVQGTIAGDRLSMLYHATPPGTDGGAALLTIMTNGKKMEGYEVGVDTTTNQPYSYAYKWTRKP